MKKLFLVLSLFTVTSYAKDFYIQANRLRFDLALNKHTRALAISNYLDFKDMGSITRLEESKTEREDNFLKDFGAISADITPIQDISVKERELNSVAFFKCIEEAISLYSYNLVQKNISINKKIELELGVSKCESFLSSDFVFPENKSIFFYFGMVSKLDTEGKELVKELFMKNIDSRVEANERFAIESLLTMISYDIQFKDITTIDMASYKERLKSEIITSTTKLEIDIKEKTDFVNAEIDYRGLVEIVEKI